VDFAYDALGRRLHKNSSAHYKQRPEAGSLWNKNEHARKQRELGCGFTLYGWDGDTLAFESSPAQSDGEPGRTVHYVFEPGTFVPVAQAVRHAPIDLMGQPDYSGEYSLDEDPLWNHKSTALPFDALGWYQCDHLGTPQELTDSQGNMAWTAQYKAWGQVTEQRSEWARQHGVMNPIRFQGQYHDHETGLHYNRYRYYDPGVGRFVSKDPISYAGGLNLYSYAPNPIGWMDPLGLTPCQKKKCAAHLSAIYRKSEGTKSANGARGLQERVDHLHEDKYDLYRLAPKNKMAVGPLRGKGSYDGHVQAAKDLQMSLQGDINKFDSDGCDKYYRVPTRIREMAHAKIPTAPAGR
jgi:RHS repeat-associated protein